MVEIDRKIPFEFRKTFTTEAQGKGFAELDPLKSNERQDYGQAHLIGGMPEDLSRYQVEELRVEMTCKLASDTGWDKDTIWSATSVSGIVFIHIKDPKLLETYKEEFNSGRRGFKPAKYVHPSRR